MNDFRIWTVYFMPVRRDVDWNGHESEIRLHDTVAFEVFAKNVAEAAEKATAKMKNITPSGRFCLLRAELTNFSKSESVI